MKKLIMFSMMIIIVRFATGQDESRRIDSLVEVAFDNREFTGTVMVIKNGNVLVNKGYGFKDAGKKQPNDSGTIFNIASLTKTFTSALIMKLQEMKKLSVDDKLSVYYPGFPNGDKITIRQLLTHTSGIPDYVQDQAFRKSDQSKSVSLESMIDLFKNKPLNFEPGTKFSYSNSGYTMLGYIIEKVTGITYGEALSLNIFKPLKMTNTSFGPPHDSIRLAKGYSMYFKNFQRMTTPVDPSISYATGGIYSTTGDLLKWHIALQDNRFLAKTSLEQIYKKDRGSYGFGWFTDTLYSKQRVSHDGNIQGYKSNINRFPQDNTCVIALANSNNSGVGGLVRNIVNILYRQPFSKSIMDAPVTQLPDSTKPAYTGVYRYGATDREAVSVVLLDNELYLKIPGSDDIKLDALNSIVFRSGTARIEFSGSDKGSFSQIMVFKNGEFLGAQKSK